MEGPKVPHRKVGFLFNHDHVHQVAHSAPVAYELSRAFPEFDVTLIVSSQAQRDMLTQIATRFPGHRCTTLMLEPRRGSAWLNALLDRLAPVRKLWLLKDNVELFRGYDALVVPEKTSLMLRTRFGLEHLTMIHTRHGAGDRAVGFDGHSGGFDLVLLAGEKIRQRLEAGGRLGTTEYAVVGYPKFDAVGALDAQPRKLFDNDRPTVLYNPHCAPNLSSWYRMGLDIVEWFYRSNDYNLIVAPHVMLYRRRLQTTIAPFSLAWAPSIPQRYRECPHLLIDLGSAACTDMSYTIAADIYLGDVSSQICEFLVRPRPCLFANAHHVAWQNDPSYRAWQLGPVFEQVSELPLQLRRAIDQQDRFRPLQEAYVRETFDLTETLSSHRAATAIAGFLARKSPRN